MAASVLGEIRKAKTEAGVSLRADVETAAVIDTAERLALLQPAIDDVKDSGCVATLTTETAATADDFAVTVVLAPPAAED